LKRLAHENIVALREVLEEPARVYIVMEFVSGGELMQHIKEKGALSEDEARTKFKCILSVIDHLHENDIVHRDLKPENILLTEDGTVKVHNRVVHAFSPEPCTLDGLSAYCVPYPVAM
jgi:serine/threonine protein kinase